MDDQQPGRSRTPTLFVMVGLPGSGKTTLAKALEQRHGAVRLTKDDWMMPLFGWGEHGDRRPIVEDLLWSIGARALQLGVDVVLDYGLWARQERDDVRARAAAVGARVDMRFLDVPDDELVRRLEARAARPGPTDVPITRQQLAAWIPRFERPTPQEIAEWRADGGPPDPGAHPR